MKKKKMIQEVAEDILNSAYDDKDYKRLALDLIEQGLKQWSVKDLKDYHEYI